MTTRTDLGRELEAALAEVLAHVRGEAVLPSRIVDDPAAEHIVALRKRMKIRCLLDEDAGIRAHLIAAIPASPG